MEQVNTQALAEWAGLHHYPDCECINGKGICWGESEDTYGKNGKWHFVLPDFTNSLDACFKWLIPKLSSPQVRALLRDWGNEIVLLDKFNEKECALVLCLAIERLIDDK